MDRARARTVGRLARGQPKPRGQPSGVAATSSRPLETPLLVSGLRCTLRYVVLPLVLPLLGASTRSALDIATGAALAVLLTLDVIAAVAILAMLRRLWQARHPRRWLYLPPALLLAVLVVVFFVNDARPLFG
jgi:hypothetical protein